MPGGVAPPGVPVFPPRDGRRTLSNITLSAQSVNPSLRNSATAKRVGRPPSPTSLKFHTVGFISQDWEWLSLWFPGGNRTDQLRELFERAKKFWPGGPGVFR